MDKKTSFVLYPADFLAAVHNFRKNEVADLIIALCETNFYGCVSFKMSALVKQRFEMLQETIEKNKTHHLALRRKNGTLAGPFIVVPGENSTEVVLTEEPDAEILTDTKTERMHFAFGTADKWRVLARVTGIRPRSTKVEITAIIEDNRVHQS